MSGWETQQNADGSVTQSAVRTTPDIPSSLHEVALGQPVRALVLAVRYPDEVEANTPLEATWAVMLDVRTLGAKQRYLANVPLYQMCAGLHDEDVRVPRPCSVALDGSALATEVSGPDGVPPTEASNTDGDIVMIYFEGGDPKKPFAAPFGPPHARRQNLTEQADGRVRRIRHNGTLIEIDAEGNVLIDASEASQDVLTAVGGEQDSPTGKVTIKARNGQLVNLQEATDALIKGTTFWSEMQTMLDVLGAWVATATGGAPMSGGAAVKQAIDAFKATASNWLSTRVKTG